LSSETQALIANRNPLHDLETSVSIAPGINFAAGSSVDLTGRFNGYDRFAGNANDGLFLINAAAPYSAQISGGNFVDATIALASDLRFSVGHASRSAAQSAFDVPLFSGLMQSTRSALFGRSADATFVSADWNFAPASGLNLTASGSAEQNSLAASVDQSKAALSKVSSNAIAASAHVGLGDGWVTTVSYSQGVTQLDLKPTNLLGASLDTRAYSVSVAKHGLFAENDSLGLAVSRPIEDFAGRLSVAPLNNTDGLGGNPLLPFGARPETDLELGYVTSFFNGALALQANAAYQMNVEGQNGTNSLTVLSRAKINF
jgi:hypothetical protein